MHAHMKSCLVLPVLLTAGCAGIEFEKEGLTYYDPTPYLFLSFKEDCTYTATVLMLPTTKTHLKLRNGLGSAKLSVTLKDGMIQTIGQDTDLRAETLLPAISGLINLNKSTAGGPGGPSVVCSGHPALYEIKEGGNLVRKNLPAEVKTVPGTGPVAPPATY